MKAYPAYKETEIQWVGMVPTHWIKHRISQLLEIVSEIGNSADELLSVYLDRGVIKHSESNGMQVHKPSKDMSNYQRVEIGDLVCNNQQAWRGSVGISPHKGRISPAYIIFRLSCLLCPEYANYFFRSQAWNPAFVLSSKGVGSIQRNLYIPWLKQHSCYLPSIQEQNAIVSYLDKKCAEIDELVSRRLAIIERLKELKQSIIAEAVTKGLNPDVPMKDSGAEWMGEVPAHWEVRRFSVEFSERRTKVSDKEYSPLSVTKSGILPQLEKVAKTDNGDNRKLVKIGDFVINSRSDRKGSSGLSSYEGSVSLINHVLIPSSSWERTYIHHLLRSIPFQEEFYRKGHGIVADLWTTRYTDIASSYIPFPPQEEQQIIAHHLDKKCAEIDTLISRQEQIIEKLKELKTSTIAHVVTGKVDVRDTL